MYLDAFFFQLSSFRFLLNWLRNKTFCIVYVAERKDEDINASNRPRRREKTCAQAKTDAAEKKVGIRPSHCLTLFCQVKMMFRDIIIGCVITLCFFDCSVVVVIVVLLLDQGSFSSPKCQAFSH